MMTPDFTQYLDNQQDSLVASLKELISVPSVLDDGGGGYPFGEAVHHALQKVADLCAELGFQAHYDGEGYYAYADIGQGDELVAVLGHMDVVPPGDLESWNADPFDPVVADGKLFGRGAQDDKGPTLAAIFAAKALMDAGVTFNKRLRFIFGGDEESLWRGVARYAEKEEPADMGFSPDSRFPLTYAEKGLLQAVLEASNQSSLPTMHLGGAFNAVPDKVVYTGDDGEIVAAKLDELGFACELTGDGVVVAGKAAHAMNPEEGVNAVVRLAMALDALGSDSKAVHFLAQMVKEDPQATDAFGSIEDDVSGKLTFNVGKLDIDDVERVSVDIRIPVTVDKEEVVAKLRAAAAEYGLEYREYDWLASLYVPLDHPLVRTLMQVYQDVTGDENSKPMVSGGATYARTMPNCVAYGALFPGKEQTEHQPNEAVVLDDLYKAMEVYAYALYKLLV
jgi:predicted dipeptidase